MKKIALILVVLVTLSSTSMAAIDVRVYAEQDGDSNWVDIKYTVTGGTGVGGANTVRAFALTIDVNNSATIDQCNAAIEGESEDPNKGYGIFVGSFVSEGNWGNPIAPPGDTNAVGQLGDPAITVEFGSLYVDAANAPGDAGTLCSIEVSGECCVNIELENIRGGILMEDGNPPTGTITRDGCCVAGGEEECDCWGDVSSGAGPGIRDSNVSLSDIFYVYDLIKDYPDDGYIVALTDPNAAGYECADVSSGAGAGVQDANISLSDVFHLYDHIKVYPETGYEAPCMCEVGGIIVPCPE